MAYIGNKLISEQQVRAVMHDNFIRLVAFDRCDNMLEQGHHNKPSNWRIIDDFYVPKVIKR